MAEDRNLFDSDKERSRERLFRLIDESGIDGAEKELLKSLTGNLLEYQRDKFHAILSRYEQTVRKPDAPAIVTGLMKKDNRLDGRFFTLPAAENGAFAVCDYNDFVESVGFFQDIERSERQYEGSAGNRKFFYRLKRSDYFLNYERRLRRLANQYGIRDFVIHSPLFRRYVRLEAVEPLNGAEEKNVNYRLRENGLENKLRLCREYDLFTNISEQEKTPALRETPGNPGDGQDICFHFQTDGREYVDFREWPDFLKKSGAEFLRGDKETCVRISNASVFPYSLAFQSWTFADYTPPDCLRFENRTGDLRPARIQSRADIEMALRALPGLPFEDYFPGKKPENLRLCQYESEWAYEGEPLFPLANRCKIYVRFQNDGTPFLFDRIAFGLSCLNAWYPECLWLGGYV